MRHRITTYCSTLWAFALCLLVMAPQAQAQRQALSLSGEGIVQTADAPDVDITGGTITVEVWIKHDGTSDENAIILNKGTTNNGYRLSFYGSGEEPGIRFAIADIDDANQAIYSNSGVPAEQWTHVAATYDGSQFAIYINGELDNTEQMSNYNVGANDNALVIGSDNGGTGRFYHGEIDDLRLWATSRTRFDLDDSPYAQLTGSESGLLAFYTFNDASDFPVSDLAGADNALTLSGSAALVTPGIHPVPPIAFALAENGQVELQWNERLGPDDENAAAQFKVYRSTAADGSDRAEVATMDGATTSFTDSGLDNGTVYYYEVTTIVGDDESDYSKMIASRPYAALGGGSLTLESGNYATMSHRPSLNGFDQNLVNFAQTITVEAWIKHDGMSDENAIILNKGTTNNGYRLSFYGSGEEPGIRFAIADIDDSNQAIYSNSGVPAGQWTHVAATYDGAQFAVYINGELDNTRPMANYEIGTNDDPLRIGVDNGGTGRFFSGRLDELRLWNVARTQPEIAADYREELVGDEESLIAYFRFNDVGNASAQSSDDQHETMELLGTAALSAPGVFPLPPYGYAEGDEGTASLVWNDRNDAAAGEFNVYRSTTPDGSDRTEVATAAAGTVMWSDTDVTNEVLYYYEVTAVDANGQESDYSAVDPALVTETDGGTTLVLDGTDDFATLTHRPSLNGFDQNLVNFAQTITVEAWIKHDGTSEDNAIILNKGTTNNGYRLSLYGSGAEPAVRFAVSDIDDNNQAIISSSSVPAGEWTHVAATYDGAQFAIYLNGELDNTRPMANYEIGTNDDPVRIGSDNGGTGRFYSGQIDELRLWNVARTQPEIAADYREELVGNEEGLVAYFRFNEPGSMIAHSSATLPMTAELMNDANMGDVSALPEEPTETLPKAVVLNGNYPNPFSGVSTIRFALPEPTPVRLTVYDLLGREVATLVDATRPAGTHDVQFDARSLSSGVYVYRFEAGSVIKTQTMTVAR